MAGKALTAPIQYTQVKWRIQWKTGVHGSEQSLVFDHKELHNGVCVCVPGVDHPVAEMKRSIALA